MQISVVHLREGIIYGMLDKFTNEPDRQNSRY